MAHVSTEETAEWPLRQHALLASSDADEIRQRVGQELSDHSLDTSGASLAARLYGTKVDALTVYQLEYGGAVAIETQPAESFLLVHTALSGCVSIESSEGRWAARPGYGVILPWKAPLRLGWSAGATQLILKIPLNRLHAVHNELTGGLLGQDSKSSKDWLATRRWKKTEQCGSQNHVIPSMRH